MRNQIRRSSGGGGGGGGSVSSSTRSIERTDSDSISRTPPHSPQSVRRYLHQGSDYSAGSKGKSADRVSNYTVVHRGSVMSANRSVGSTRSVTSSASSSDMNLFDAKHPNAGFTFDAFGLDASIINREVSAAMHDIAGNNPDLSFFLDQDPTDDFAAGRWDSPPGSRSGSPVTEEEGQDGFVDGFRVNTKAAVLPFHVRQSPTSTEKSSLTSETGSSDIPADGRVNLFKQQAGFHNSKPRKVVRPDEVAKHSPRHRAVPIQKDMQLPDLEEHPKQPSIPNRQHPNEADFFDADFSDFSASSMNGDKQQEQALSDVGVSSDFSPSVPKVDILAELKARKEERSLASADDCNMSVQTQTEKKEDEEAHVRSVGTLASQWEMKERARRSEVAQAAIQRPHASPTRSSPSRPAVAYDREKSSAPKQFDDIEEKSSFASVREQLRPVHASAREAAIAGSKSDAGVLGKSHVTSILSGLEAARRTRDSQSDVGAPSPALAGRMQSTENAPSALTGESFSGSSHTADVDNHLISSIPSEDSSVKRTYMERRKLELKQQQDEEEKNRQREPENLDVATLIKRRIAANKKCAVTESSNDRNEGLMFTESMKPYDESPRRTVNKQFDELSDSNKAAYESRSRLDRNRPAELSLAATPTQPKRNTAVSHLQMLQQIQQQTRGDEDDLAPARSEASESDDRNHKSTTPKATMMMLNAFLAGRNSLARLDAAASKSSVQSSHDRRDESADPSGKAAISPAGDEQFQLPARKDDPKYEKYYKMLKLGMPVEVVKHAMTRDGVDPSVLDGDPNTPVGIPLKHDPEFAKYFKMLSIGLPMDAVKHAMARDGLDSSVMDQDHDLPLMRKTRDDDEPKEQDSHRRARLHWKTLRSVTSNSLWAKIDQDDELGAIKFNEKEFQELFQMEKASDAEQKGASASNEPKRGGVRVIDPKRANNGGIILARLKMSHDDMADAVDGINERALTAEQIEHIIEYLPTRDERKALENYMLEGGQDAAEKFDGLCECEKFMVSMMTVKHANRKVRALLFKLQFQTCLEDIHRDTVLVETACDELCNSVRLRKLLGIVLTFGNRLNTAGNGKHRAGAFTLDSLLKLNQAKAFDKKTTFLHYIVLIVQRNNELLLRFKDDLPTVFKADRVFWDQCVNDLEEVENQLENVRKIALHQARQATMYRLRKKKREEDEESLSDDENELTLEEEVEALRATPIGMFTLSAIKYVSSLRDRVEETRSKFARLLEYFGEESNMQPHELFSTIVTFSRDFDKAKEEVFANEKRKQREERKRQAVVSNGMASQHGRPPTHSPAQPERKLSEQPTLKASNHQPSMGHVLDELKTRLDRSVISRSKVTEAVPASSPTIQPHTETREDKTPNGSSNGTYRATEQRSQASIMAEREMARKAQSSGASTPSRQPDLDSTPELQRNGISSTSRATPPTSSPAPPMSGASLKAKARMRMNRNSIEKSTTGVSPTVAASPELSRSSRPPVIMLSPVHVQTRSPALAASGSDDGAMPPGYSLSSPKPLSPRSSMRHRMERHKLRQQAPGPSSSATPASATATL